VYLAVTIDTEEDNWGEYDRPSFSVENISRIPRLQEIFAAHGIRPTYLVTYPVATSPEAVDILKSYHAAGACEIGSHLHPWNTPPVEEERTPFNSFVSHLPVALQLRKIRTLHDAIAGNFGVEPTSFRSGRWGFSDEVAWSLMQMGYRVDTSISPALDWREYQGPDYSNCSDEPFLYRVQGSTDRPGQSLLEVPATVGFVQGGPLAARVYRTIRSKVPAGPKILAALDRLGAVNRVCVSPEIDDARSMTQFTRARLARGASGINMFFHSPSLLERCSPYVSTPEDLSAFLERIDAFLTFARSAGLRSATMSELAAVELGNLRVQFLPASPA
jgi:peptidoglycan/xylan/chitin deacetylase (PgdA/CDA1 family)